MSDTPVFQGHHVIEQQSMKNSTLLRVLEKQGLYDIDSPRNLLNLPAKRELAAQLDLPPHPGGPLGEYKTRLLRELNKLETSTDGQAALDGDLGAAKRIAEKVGHLEDTMKAGLVNNDLISNAPKGMTRETANQKIKDFFGKIDTYDTAHAEQIDKLGKMQPDEAMWAGVTKSEANVKTALEAIDREGVKAAKGDASAADASLKTAVEEARNAGRLPSLEPVPTELPGATSESHTKGSDLPSAEPNGPGTKPADAPPAGAGPEPAAKGINDAHGISAPHELPGNAAELPPIELHGPGIKPPDVSPSGYGPELGPKGLSGTDLAVKGVGAAGVAMIAYDFVTTGNKMMTLRTQGNAVGAESAGTHFIGRNAGGLIGGFGAGFLYGAIAGSETGPGALATGLAGGVVGAFVGEKWADQKDREKVFNQTDREGNVWTRNPDDPSGAWTRAIQMPMADGGYRQAQASAAGRLTDELNYQSANASYGLGLANPPKPQDPFSLPGNASDAHGVVKSNWSRDAQTGGWSRVVMDRLPMSEFDSGDTHTEQASPQRTVELNAQSSLVIAQNAANSPVAIAARYEIAYNEFNWKEFGPKSEAVSHAATQTQTLQASDGNIYTHDANGQWTTPGMLYGSTTATGNIRDELNLTLQSQQAGLQKMAAMATLAKEQPHPTEVSMRSQVENAYARAGMPRSEAQIDAATNAVTLSHARDDIKSDFSLQVRPDQSIATLVGHNDGRMEVKSVTTAQDIARAQQQTHTAAPKSAEQRSASPQPQAQPHPQSHQPGPHSPPHPQSHPHPQPHPHPQKSHTQSHPQPQVHPESHTQPHTQPQPHIRPVPHFIIDRHRQLGFREEDVRDRDGMASTGASIDAEKAATARNPPSGGLGKPETAVALAQSGQPMTAPGGHVDDPAEIRSFAATPGAAQNQNEAQARAAKPGSGTPNPWEQTVAGQFLEKYFAASQNGDNAAAARLADNYAQTPQYQAWQQWGQNNLQQQASEQQRQVAQATQPSQGRSL